jgi:predicted enzyme related to lactoylglutathione lyase
MPRAPPAFIGPMLIVHDFETSLAFYRDIIRLQGDGKSPYAEFVSNSCKLVLLDHTFWTKVGGLEGSSTPSERRGGVVLAVQVENIDEEYHRLQAAGVAIASPLADRPMMGLRNFQVHDPDGNLVELTSPLTP